MAITGPHRGRIARASVFFLALVAPLLATLVLTRAESAGSKPARIDIRQPVRTHRLILPINTDDPTVMRALISTSLNLPKYYQDRNEPFTIEVVAYNAGIHMLRLDTSPVKDLLKLVRTINPTIRFVVCEATKIGMERGEGHPISFIEGVELVPSGPGRIIELQEAGWSYIRS